MLKSFDVDGSTDTENRTCVAVYVVKGGYSGSFIGKNLGRRFCNVTPHHPFV